MVSKKKVKHCSFDGCKTKLKLISYDCKCGNTFCSKHRYTSEHNCPSLNDKQKNYKEILKKNNPVVKSNKVNKI